MRYTQVRNYTSNQLLERVRSLKTFSHFPMHYWLLGVRSNEDIVGVYDDKIYIFRGEVFQDVMTATTSSGSYGFRNWRKWSKRGVGMIKSDECYYNVWRIGKHQGVMDALRQVGAFKIIRRKSVRDKNRKWSWERKRGFNFHCNTYDTNSKLYNWMVRGWSVGCQVVNDRVKYFKKWMPIFLESRQQLYSYILLEEF